MALSTSIIAAVVAGAIVLPAAAAQSDTAGLGASIGQLVESLKGGGERPGQLLFAADSASAALLDLAGISTVTGKAPARLLCPGSTNEDAQPVPPPFGYVVHVTLSAGADSTSRHIDVSKDCSFRFSGRGRGFAQGGTWELRLRDGRWYVARSLGLFIT